MIYDNDYSNYSVPKTLRHVTLLICAMTCWNKLVGCRGFTDDTRSTVRFTSSRVLSVFRETTILNVGSLPLSIIWFNILYNLLQVTIIYDTSFISSLPTIPEIPYNAKIYLPHYLSPYVTCLDESPFLSPVVSRRSEVEEVPDGVDDSWWPRVNKGSVPSGVSHWLVLSSYFRTGSSVWLLVVNEILREDLTCSETFRTWRRLKRTD